MKITYKDGCVRIIALKTARESFMLQRIEDYIRVYNTQLTILQGNYLYVKVEDHAEFEEFKRNTYFKAKHIAQAEARVKFDGKVKCQLA